MSASFGAAVSAYVDKASRIRRESGLLALAGRALRRAMSPVVRWGAISFFEHAGGVAEPSAAPAIGVHVRRVCAEEWAKLVDGMDPTRDPVQIRSRLGSGDAAYAAFDAAGRAVHVRWVSTGPTPIPEIGRVIVPGARQAYFYDAHTRPDARGKGIDGAVRCVIFAALDTRGVTRVYSYARHDNPVAMRAAARWQRCVGTIRYLRIGPLPPLLLGRLGAGYPTLVRPDAGGAARRAAWRRWFGSWPTQPLARRSTGCSALPDEAFAATARHIADVLELARGDRVLDVGCDSAMVSRHVMPRCARHLGIDFVTALLVDSRRLGLRVAGGGPAWLVAGDATTLPIRSDTFDKAYCSAVLHTLPSRHDGLAVIEELVRVVRPGGRVLVASVPERARRGAMRAGIWRRASWPARLTLPVRWLMPAAVRRWGRRLTGLESDDPPAFLDYDLHGLSERLRVRGLACEVRLFPGDYWSRDFRETRANLIIDLPHVGLPP
jgi:SAM-dependent methyltransferase